MYCHEIVLEVAQNIVRQQGKNQFSIGECVKAVMASDKTFKENTILTHITSRCCIDAPPNHYTRYDYFERIPGVDGYYRLTEKYNPI